MRLHGWKGPTVKALPSVEYEAPKKNGSLYELDIACRGNRHLWENAL
jgi:hypothetical protein